MVPDDVLKCVKRYWATHLVDPFPNKWLLFFGIGFRRGSTKLALSRDMGELIRK